MIASFGDKDTEKIWKGERVKGLPEEVQNVGRRKLRMLNNAFDLKDLEVFPGNRLEKLKGSEFYSIRINSQWRIVFKWERGNSEEVEIIDYH
jgi:toxin HigB-1